MATSQTISPTAGRRAAWRDAVKDSDLPPIPRLVALLMADYWPAAGASLVWVDVPTLIRQSGASRATVYRALDVLRAEGWLEQVSGPKQHRAPRYMPLIPGAQGSQAETQGSHSETEGSHAETRHHKTPKKTPPSPSPRAALAALPSPTGGDGEKAPENPRHIHEPNARRALAALGDLPLDVDELVSHCYRLGEGDPWSGYLHAKPLLEESLTGARNPARVLRARLTGGESRQSA